MTWIRTIPLEEASEELREAMQTLRASYPVEYASPVSPGGDSIMASHTLMPKALHHIFAALAAMMESDLPLERRQHEMIATVVSEINRCFY